MHNWFECKVSYEKIMENGMQKKVTEPYLVDALSFTEAEARITEQVQPYISGEFTITDIKRAKISEIFYNENGDRYFNAKICYITLDEKIGQERRTSVRMIAQANVLKEAIGVIEDGISGTLADYVITSISETDIMDIFPFTEIRPKDLFSSMGVTVTCEITGVKDPLFDEAVNLFRMNETASTSLLQRNFSIGFKRAEQLMSQLEAAGIVGPLQGNQPRAILMNK